MLQFVREIPIRIVLEETPSESRRGFLFRVAAGFEKKIDPESGMSVDLVSVDRWMQELKSMFESSILPVEQRSVWRADVAHQAQVFLATRAQDENAHLASLQFEEERGGGFGWRADWGGNLYLSKSSEFIELFHPLGRFDLVRVEFFWKCSRNQTADLKKMGKKIVRHCSRKGAGQFTESLQAVLGLTLPDRSQLHNIEIHYLAESYKITLTNKSPINRGSTRQQQ